MEEIKQVIVVRKDLNMRKGKLAAQVAHASLKIIVDRLKPLKDFGFEPWEDIPDLRAINVGFDTVLQKWFDGPFVKIVVSVDSEVELLKLYSLAKIKKIFCVLIRDAGRTEFKEPTHTCIAIGPDYSEKIDELTGNLPLM